MLVSYVWVTLGIMRAPKSHHVHRLRSLSSHMISTTYRKMKVGTPQCVANEKENGGMDHGVC